MPPKKPANKAELLDQLCEKLEKLTGKAEAALDKAKSERSLELMNEADGFLDAGKDALDAHGKIPPKDKKKRILPIMEHVDALRKQINDARKAEQVCNGVKGYFSSDS